MMIRTLRTAVLTGVTAAAGISTALLLQTAAHAATPTFDQAVAYTRDGAIYTSSGKAEKRLTGRDDNSRPRWSTDHRSLAYLHAGELWQMNANGSGKHRVTPGRAAGAAFSPDGQWLAYSAPACLGGPGVYRVKSTAPHGVPEVLFPVECRGQAAPAPTTPDGPTAGALADRLRYDDAIAWSPDGTKIVFRGGGNCEAVYDNCLTVGTVATGGERAIAAFGGGGSEDGFASVPAFRPDGAKVAWTAYSGDEVHVVEASVDGSAKRQVGTAEDRELTYSGTGRALVTAQRKGRSWIMVVNLATGKRKPFHAGSQPAA